ncbi:uncharacterized protein PHALS_05945 [Plasmopara halstedii]|uniref:MULE transposase domain-containing protein n=1 Tax=Plasmopara halstedii TaxID=4781 RepID=A0A0P1ABA2_PLAHL|nr:uncharacterized protein PHALS_05945 [Plasmopara halstedii]CEG37897.1 hypothetical protein PHALS_05945 [Plasmopara halstedii]|eukprot:XP_024574266.1 hypothetical protein PHALS_05945 [Plasmopara halstedii]
MEMEELKQKRWTNDKEAVRAIKDVTLAQGKSRFRSKNQPGDWHVTGGNLDHQNCVSVAKPSRIQLVNNPVRSRRTASTPKEDNSVTARDVSRQGLCDGRASRWRPLNIRLLPSLLAEFQHLNTGVLTEVQCDERGRFRRAIVLHSPSWFTNGPGVYGVDAAHIKHRKYKGVQIVMVGRDGNLTDKIVAVALAPVKNYDSYLWFFSKILHHGFPLTECPVFSDRNVSLVSVAESLGIFIMFCVRHIIGNMRTDKTVRLTVTQEQLCHTCKQVDTSTQVNTTPLYGWRTTNFVESKQAMSLRLKPRKMQPYKIFKSYLTIFMGEAYNRVRLGQLWVNAERKLTPRAEHDVAFTARISNPMKQRRVEMKNRRVHACRHLIATLLECNMAQSAYELMGECYRVALYQENLGKVEIPQDDLLTADLSISPAAYVRQAGRPRKRRIRSYDEVGGKARKPYKCTISGVLDHNRATCRLAA